MDSNLLCHKLAYACREILSSNINDQSLKAYAEFWLDRSKDLLVNDVTASNTTYDHMLSILNYFNKILSNNGLKPVAVSL